MRKALVILGILGVLAFAVSAQAVPTTTTVTLDLYGMVNNFCSPIIPFNPHLWNDAAGEPDYNGCFVNWMSDPGLGGTDKLFILDPVTQNTFAFPDVLFDHPILMGDGYTASVAGTLGVVAQQLTYSGVDISDTDAYISLPGQPNGGGGLHHIGIPYPVGTTIDWMNIVVTDGTESFTLYDLISAEDYRWGQFEFFTTDAATQNSYSVPGVGDTTLYGGQGYYIQTTKSNLALILPHPVL